jgi:hypothetical protein
MASIGLSGGRALEARLRQIAENSETSAELRAGFLENATYPDGTHVATVAAIQEFGAPNAGIPSRPFFRGMIAKESPHWADDVAKLLVASNYDAMHALASMGMEIKNELQDAIKAFDTPALAPATIARKGFDKVLIDTGHMWQSIDYEVS